MGGLPSPYLSESLRRLTDEGLRVGAELVPAKSIILSTRAPIGHLVINEVPMAFNQGCKGLVPLTGVDTKFAYYFLLANVPLLESLGTGATFRELSGGKLKEVPFFFPALPEQRRIVAILDESFEAIATAKANTEKNLQAARELFDSVLDSALSHCDKDALETTLGSEVDLLAGYAFPSTGYSVAADGIRLLRGDNIMQGYLRWDNAKHWPADGAEDYARFALREGDVVLAMDRPWVKAGLKRAQIGTSDLPCLQLQRTARLRPKRSMSAEFLFHLTGSRSFSQHLLSVQTGLGVPHISGKQIESYRFTLPSPSEQAAITGKLNDLQQRSERLEEVYRQKLTALDELKQSLLHQAFTGALTARSADQALDPVA